MGPVPEDPAVLDITLSNDPAMSKRLAGEARQAGAIGEICYWGFTANGEEARTPHRAIGLGFDGLKHLAADAGRDVVLVCGGDRFRIEPLQTALRAGLANVLVTCTVTAAVLVGEMTLPREAGRQP
jgi:DNA-binding transcriptional regulator LsrR (DeoR family)